jgi:hypothetical protein
MGIERLEGLRELENTITSSEIGPATFQLAALRLKQLRYCLQRTMSIITLETTADEPLSE